MRRANVPLTTDLIALLKYDRLEPVMLEVPRRDETTRAAANDGNCALETLAAGRFLRRCRSDHRGVQRSVLRFITETRLDAIRVPDVKPYQLKLFR